MSKSNCNCDLLLWKNPVETGKIFFGSILALLILKKVNLITFFLRVFYTVFLTTGTIEFVSKAFLGQGLVTKYGVKECPNTVGMIKPYVDNILKQLPVKQAKMRMLVFAYVPKNTFKAALVTYCLHKLFSWFSLWCLLFVGDLAIFSLPIIYKTYQTEIDAVLTKGCKCGKTKINQVSKQICDAVEPHVKKIGPLNKFLQNLKKSNETPVETPVETSSATTTGTDLPSVPETKPEQTTQEFDIDDLVKDTAEKIAEKENL